MAAPPTHIDLKRDRGLTIEWADGSTSYYSVAFLRKMSPSAETRQLREEQKKNPLTVLPSAPPSASELTVVDVEMVGNYAIKLVFSDGHDTGIYSWAYLQDLQSQS